VFGSPRLHLYSSTEETIYFEEIRRRLHASHRLYTRRRRRKSPADRYYIRYAASSSMTALSRRRVLFPRRAAAECQIVIAAGDRPINCNANTVARRRAAPAITVLYTREICCSLRPVRSTVVNLCRTSLLVGVAVVLLFFCSFIARNNMIYTYTSIDTRARRLLIYDRKYTTVLILVIAHMQLVQNVPHDRDF